MSPTRPPTTNSVNFQTLSTRNQLFNKEKNYQDIPYPNQYDSLQEHPKFSLPIFNKAFYSDFFFSKNRFHLEPLKNSDNDTIPVNPDNGYSYRPIYNTRSHETFKPNSYEYNYRCLTISLIILGTTIGLFAVTALVISIYLLIRGTTWTSAHIPVYFEYLTIQSDEKSILPFFLKEIFKLNKRIQKPTLSVHAF